MLYLPYKCEKLMVRKALYWAINMQELQTNSILIRKDALK